LTVFDVNTVQSTDEGALCCLPRLFPSRPCPDREWTGHTSAQHDRPASTSLPTLHPIFILLLIHSLTLILSHQRRRSHTSRHSSSLLPLSLPSSVLLLHLLTVIFVLPLSFPPPLHFTMMNTAGCSNGHDIQSSFTCCGVAWAILCFPIGLICCFSQQERRCVKCGGQF
jgi:hypothetical protein